MERALSPQQKDRKLEECVRNIIHGTRLAHASFQSIIEEELWDNRFPTLPIFLNWLYERATGREDDERVEEEKAKQLSAARLSQIKTFVRVHINLLPDDRFKNLSASVLGKDPPDKPGITEMIGMPIITERQAHVLNKFPPHLQKEIMDSARAKHGDALTLAKLRKVGLEIAVAHGEPEPEPRKVRNHVELTAFRLDTYIRPQFAVFLDTEKGTSLTAQDLLEDARALLSVCAEEVAESLSQRVSPEVSERWREQVERLADVLDARS